MTKDVPHYLPVIKLNYGALWQWRCAKLIPKTCGICRRFKKMLN